MRLLKLLPKLLIGLLPSCALFAAPAAEEGPTILGINDHVLYRTAAEHASVFNVYRDTDTRFLRINIDWMTLEPSAGVYSKTRLENLDLFFAEAAETRIRVLASIAYAPSWANGGKQGAGWPPTDFAAYADFCEWIMRRYAPYVNQDGNRILESIEIWNEPDLCDLFFKGYSRQSPDAARVYAEMVKVAGPRLMAVRVEIGAPDLLICAPAISNIHETQWAPSGKSSWIDAFYSVEGVTKCYDVVSLHSYWEHAGSTGWLPPELPACWDATNQKISVVGRVYHPESGRSLIDRMKAAGDGEKEIWITEIGGSARGDEPEHAQRMLSFYEQKAHLEDVIRLLRGGQIPNLKRVYWYEIFDEPHAQREQRYYGLIGFGDKFPLDYGGPLSLTNATFKEKPAYAVYRNTMKSRYKVMGRP